MELRDETMRAVVHMLEAIRLTLLEGITANPDLIVETSGPYLVEALENAVKAMALIETEEEPV